MGTAFWGRSTGVPVFPVRAPPTWAGLHGRGSVPLGPSPLLLAGSPLALPSGASTSFSCSPALSEATVVRGSGAASGRRDCALSLLLGVAVSKTTVLFFENCCFLVVCKLSRRFFYFQAGNNFVTKLKFRTQRNQKTRFGPETGSRCSVFDEQTSYSISFSQGIRF